MVIVACFICPVTLFFSFENGVANCHKECCKFIVNNVWRFQKFTVSSISRFGDTKAGRWAYVTLDKSGYGVFE